MPGIDYYLRLLVQADKESKITAMTITDTPTRFSSYLTRGYLSKSLSVYNNSDQASGELYYGYKNTIAAGVDSMPIPKGALVDIPVASGENTPIYFVADTGEIGDLRVEELA